MKKVLILAAIRSIKYPAQGIGCALDDAVITDIYEAAAYGWNEAIERVAETIENCSNLTNWMPVSKVPTLTYVEDGDDGYFVSSKCLVAYKYHHEILKDFGWFTEGRGWSLRSMEFKLFPSKVEILAWQPVEPYIEELHDSDKC